MMGTIVDFEQLYLDAKHRIRELEAELAALRQQQGEPVAWIYAEDQGRGHRFLSELPPTSHHPQDLADAEVVVTPLYREAAPRVPEGWKLVPVEPTPEMKEAGERERMSHVGNINPCTTWTAMLAAAPQPPDCKSEIQSGDCDESDNIKDIFSKT